MREKIKSSKALASAIVIAAALVVVAMNPPKLAEAQQPATSKLYSSGDAGLSVTTGNTAVTFTDNHSGGDAGAFVARGLTIRSDDASANSCSFDFLDTVATSADPVIPPGGAFSITLPGGYSSKSGYSGIGLICATGTATFHVTAFR